MLVAIHTTATMIWWNKDIWAVQCRTSADTKITVSGCLDFELLNAKNARRRIVWRFTHLLWCSKGRFVYWTTEWAALQPHSSWADLKKFKKGKGSPYSITERRVPKLIPVLGSQPAGDVSHKPGGRLPLLSARRAVTPATLKKAATNFAAWWTEARCVWTVRLRLLPDSVAAAIWTRALLRPSPAR